MQLQFVFTAGVVAGAALAGALYWLMCSRSFRWLYQVNFRMIEVMATTAKVMAAVRKRHEGNLPHNANYNVEHVAEEILVLLEGRIFLQHFLQDRAPKTPRPHAPVEFLQHLFVFRGGQVGTQEAADEREEEHQAKAHGDFQVESVGVSKILQGCDFCDQRGDGHRGRHSRHHAPEITVAVEAPPIPFQDVGSGVATPQGGDDPDDHVVDAGHVPAEEHAEEHYQKGTQIAQAHVGLGAGMGIDEALVDIVDEVGRGGVYGRGEVGHICSQQTGDQHTEQTGGHEPPERVGKNALEIHVGAHAANLVAEEDQGQDGEPGNQEITREGEHDVHPATHHGGFAGVLAGKDALHVVVWRGARGADQDALEEEHHDEETEEPVAVLGDSRISRGHQMGPVHVEVPAKEEDVVPARGDEVLERAGGDLHHGDDAHREGRDGKDAELQHFRDYDAEHPAFDDVKGGDGDEQEGVLIDAEVPGQEGGGEFADALEAVGEETDDADEGVNDHDDVGKLRAAALAEARLDPFRASHHIRAPQPRGHIDHEEYLVERRPEPRNPDALESVHKHPVDKQHGAADIEHPRSVGNAKDVPGHDIAAQEVGLDVARGAMGNPVADQDR